MGDARIARLQLLLERLRQAIRDGDVDVLIVRECLRELRAEGVDTASALDAARAVVAAQRGALGPPSSAHAREGRDPAAFRLSVHDVALLESCGISPSRRQARPRGKKGAQ